MLTCEAKYIHRTLIILHPRCMECLSPRSFIGQTTITEKPNMLSTGTGSTKDHGGTALPVCDKPCEKMTDSWEAHACRDQTSRTSLTVPPAINTEQTLQALDAGQSKASSAGEQLELISKHITFSMVFEHPVLYRVSQKRGNKETRP